MAKKTTDKRRLIKFSNYSMCITLPKWVVDQLVWQKGDELTLVTDVKQGKITLFKEQGTGDKEDVTPDKKDSGATHEDGSLQPIPKIRW